MSGHNPNTHFCRRSIILFEQPLGCVVRQNANGCNRGRGIDSFMMKAMMR